MTTVINIESLSLPDRRLLISGRLSGHKYVGRGYGYAGFGNKYSHRLSSIPGTIYVATRAEAIERHKRDTLADPELCAIIRRELKDQVLVCWCWPLPCHAQTLADIADGRLFERTGGYSAYE